MNDFRLTVLGCNGSYPGPGGSCSGYLLRTTSTAIWLDCGSGTFANLQTHIDPRSLDAVIVSHQHADHSQEVADLEVFCKLRSVTDLPVYAAPGVLERTIAGGNPAPAFIWTTLEDGDELDIGNITMRFSLTDHPVPTFAVRAESGGRSVIYTADTGVNWSPAALGSGFDLMLAEAAIPHADGQMSGHLTGLQAGMLATQCSAQRLLLTHIRPLSDRNEIVAEASHAFGKPVVAVETGTTYDI